MEELRYFAPFNLASPTISGNFGLFALVVPDKKEFMLSFYPQPRLRGSEIGETNFRRIVVRPLKTCHT
jgi:hypothetical protein